MNLMWFKKQDMCSTLYSDGEVAGAAVSSSISSRVLDESVSYLEQRAWSVTTCYCEATTWGSIINILYINCGMTWYKIAVWWKHLWIMHNFLV